MIENGAARGLPPLTFGMVFPFSCHNYQLRYWMAAGGIDPDRDVRLVVIPPPLMVESLSAGAIDGFCVGEPWSSLAVDAGIAHILVPTAALWRASPEKVVGMRAAWADGHADTVAALIRALDAAARWADEPGNRRELADLLAQPRYLDTPAAGIARALTGQLIFAQGDTSRPVEDFLVFHRKAANFPWISHALWLYSQMLRWRQVEPSAHAEGTVRSVFRPDLYRCALAGRGTPIPACDVKVEGVRPAEMTIPGCNGPVSVGPDLFFDGRAFDPDRIGDYLGRILTFILRFT